MKQVYWDTNIILDLLGERHPFYIYAARIATLAEQSKCKIITSGLALATAFYIIEKNENRSTAFMKINNFKQLISISSIDEQIVNQALESNFDDFEDGMQYFSARRADAEILLTRNLGDFKNSKIPVMTGKEFLVTIKDPMV